MRIRRGPLLLVVALVAIGAAGPAIADRHPRPAATPSEGVPSGKRGLGGVPSGKRGLGGVSSKGGLAGGVPERVLRGVVSGRWPRGLPSRVAVPTVSVRSPAPPRNVSTDGSVPGVSVWRSPVPGVSIKGRPGKRRPVPEVTVPGMTIYPGAVCGGRVTVGECPRERPRPRPTLEPRPKPRRAQPARLPTLTPAPVPVPARTPPPTPAPTPKATPPARAEQEAPPTRRKNPLGTVLMMVVLVTTIAFTTAVAFRARR
ncbi:MAG TPA: hypothetical protein VFV66_36980 [Nonomuraea sp.]|nr:hypothetical protein [Nonomuraea sp.]